MGIWLDQNLTINANTLYANKIGGTQELVGKDAQITLPAVRNQTTDAALMGTFTVPILAQLENMEATIHHIGVVSRIASLLGQESIELEMRWIQQVMTSDAAQKAVSGRAYITGYPQTVMPEIDIQPGQSVDLEMVYTVSKYKLVVEGEVLCNIDRVASILEIGGKDYFTDLSSML